MICNQMQYANELKIAVGDSLMPASTFVDTLAASTASTAFNPSLAATTATRISVRAARRLTRRNRGSLSPWV
jgi:hypothetical protein